MKVMIFGATGLLGHALLREWHGDEIVPLGIDDIDIRDAGRVRDTVAQARPDAIVLAAAYTDVDGCESDPQLALAVNRDGAVNVAKAAKQCAAWLLFLSTDYVFDGTGQEPYETDGKRNPQSVYGRSKAEAEERLLEILPECCVVRLSWLFGLGGRCFPDTILKLAASRAAIDVVDDQRGSPTYNVDLARAMAELSRQKAFGIVHVTNAGDCSWFEFAREIVARAGLPAEVRPVSSDQMKRPARRPAYSVLSPASREQYGIEMPTWQDALERYLIERS